MSQILRNSINIVHLVGVSVPNSAKFQTACTEKIRKYLELYSGVKKPWPVEVVYSLLVTLPTTTLIPHTLLDVLKRLDPLVLLHVTLQRPVTLNTCNIFQKVLGGSKFQRYVVHKPTFAFVIKRMRW